jgi:Spy/CpxP family protein refolding chaperone
LKMLKEKVGLDEAAASEVEVVLEEFHGQRMELHEEVKARTDAVKELLTQDSNDQEAYAVALDAVMKAREEMHALKLEEIEALRKVLTPKQQAQMLMSLRRMHKKGRGFMRDGDRRGQRGRYEE